MTQFFDRMKEELQQLAHHAEVSKAKQKASGLIHQAYIPIPITARMLQTLIVQAQLEDVQKIKVDISNRGIEIRGIARKLLLKIPFSLVLQPITVQNRTLILGIEEMTPVNQNWLNQRIFNHPPHLSYEDGKLLLDLNQFEVIRQIGVGVIKGVEMKDQKVWLKIGI